MTIDYPRTKQLIPLTSPKWLHIGYLGSKKLQSCEILAWALNEYLEGIGPVISTYIDPVYLEDWGHVTYFSQNRKIFSAISNEPYPDAEIKLGFKTFLEIENEKGGKNKN